MFPTKWSPRLSQTFISSISPYCKYINNHAIMSTDFLNLNPLEHLPQVLAKAKKHRQIKAYPAVNLQRVARRLNQQCNAVL